MVAVCEWGGPTGRAILFIHGVAQSHLSFACQTVTTWLRITGSLLAAIRSRPGNIPATIAALRAATAGCGGIHRGPRDGGEAVVVRRLRPFRRFSGRQTIPIKN